jgi:hypothetical protein
VGLARVDQGWQRTQQMGHRDATDPPWHCLWRYTGVTSAAAALPAQRLAPTWLLVGSAGAAAGGGIAGSLGSDATILLTMAWIFSRSEFS